LPQESGLSAVQLHGGVSMELVRQLDGIFNGQVKLIQTVYWDVDAGDAGADLLAQQLRQIAAEDLVNRVLIDSKVGIATGGTGVPFDWNAARATLAEAGGGLKFIVAGGLRPDNVADAISQLNPWGVDVASGVEESPGHKSREKLSAFIHAARNSTT
jgi:phosphoribosylanthranilate isomerase